MGRARGQMSMAAGRREPAGGEFGGPVPERTWRAWPLSDLQRRKLDALARTERRVNVLRRDAGSGAVLATVPPRLDKHGRLTATRVVWVLPDGDLRWR